MRALVLVMVALAAGVGFAEKNVVPRDQRIIPVEDVRDKNIVVNGIRMVKSTGTRAEGIMWDEDGTTYLVKATYLDEPTAMRISYVGAAAQNQMWYRLWPVLLDRRGQVYIIDDSWQQDYLAKIQYYYTTWKGGFKAAATMGAGGTAIATAGAIDHATLNLFFDPNVPFATRFIMSGLGVGAVRAFWDMAKSHRQLERDYNFFTRQVATNVERLEYVNDPVTNVLDIKIHYLNGESRGQPEFMSQIFKAKQLSYRNPDCLKFLEK